MNPRIGQPGEVRTADMQQAAATKTKSRAESVRPAFNSVQQEALTAKLTGAAGRVAAAPANGPATLAKSGLMKEMQGELSRARLGSSGRAETAAPSKVEQAFEAMFAKLSEAKQKLVTDAIAGAMTRAGSFKFSDGSTVPPAYAKDYLLASVCLLLEKNASPHRLRTALNSPQFLKSMRDAHQQSLQKAPDRGEHAAAMLTAVAKLAPADQRTVQGALAVALENAALNGTPKQFALHELQRKIAASLANGVSASDVAADIRSAGEADRIGVFYKTEAEAMATRMRFGINSSQHPRSAPAESAAPEATAAVGPSAARQEENALHYAETTGALPPALQDRINEARRLALEESDAYGVPRSYAEDWINHFIGQNLTRNLDDVSLVENFINESLPTTSFSGFGQGIANAFVFDRSQTADAAQAVAPELSGATLKSLIGSPEADAVLRAYGITGESAAEYLETFFNVLDAMRRPGETVEQSIAALHRDGWKPPFHGGLLEMWNTLAPKLLKSSS